MTETERRKQEKMIVKERRKQKRNRREKGRERGRKTEIRYERGERRKK